MKQGHSVKVCTHGETLGSFCVECAGEVAHLTCPDCRKVFTRIDADTIHTCTPVRP